MVRKLNIYYSLSASFIVKYGRKKYWTLLPMCTDESDFPSNRMHEYAAQIKLYGTRTDGSVSMLVIDIDHFSFLSIYLVNVTA